MIDYIQTEGDFPKKRMDRFIRLNPDLKIVRPKGSERLYFWWYNMRVDYFIPSEKLRISNSIHKLWNIAVNQSSIGNHNYNDFTISDVKETIEYICNEFDIKAKEFEVIGRLEYGLNINISPLDPYKDMISYYISQQSRHPKLYGTFFNRENKVIGASANFGQYRVKFYDKSTQSKLSNKGIVRYEIVNLKNRRYKDLLGKGLVTLKDLTQKVTYVTFRADLIQQYDSILKLPHLSDNPTREMILTALEHSHPLLKEINSKRMKEWAFKQFSKQGVNQLKTHENRLGSFHQGIRNKIIDKTNFLLNLPPCNSTLKLDRQTSNLRKELTANF